MVQSWFYLWRGKATLSCRWQVRSRAPQASRLAAAPEDARWRPLRGDKAMDMTGEERIEASREAVWAALNDVEVLKRCIPGCESLERQSDTEMSAKVKLTVGPVSARFAGKVTLSEIDPPSGYRISGEGSGGAAGYAKGSALVQLADDGNGGTLLKYEARADVGGKLAQLGGRLIDATARKMAGEFFGKFGEAMRPASAEDAAVEVGAETEPAKKPGMLSRWFGKKKDTDEEGGSGPA
jgi:carbon monoxide dehydrogenase subunit G